MIEGAVEAVLAAAGAYLGFGALTAIPLHLSGLQRIDPAVRGAGTWFRMLVTPGLILFWPLLALKWFAASQGRGVVNPVERPVRPESLRRLHGLVFQVLAVVLPLVVAAAILTRTTVEPQQVPMPASAFAQASDLPADTAR